MAMEGIVSHVKTEMSVETRKPVQVHVICGKVDIYPYEGVI